MDSIPSCQHKGMASTPVLQKCCSVSLSTYRARPMAVLHKEIKIRSYMSISLSLDDSFQQNSLSVNTSFREL